MLQADCAELSGESAHRYTTKEIYRAVGTMRDELRGYHPHVIALVGRRLDGDQFGNLFGSMEESDDRLSGLAIASIHGVEMLLGTIPLALYVAFELLSFSLRFVHGKGLIHDGTESCVFERKIDRRKIVDAIKTCFVCDHCRKCLNKSMDEDQEMAIENIFSLFQKIANEDSPSVALKKQFADSLIPSPEIFLCHSSDDKNFVRRLALDLTDAGIRVWFDAWEIRVGDNIVEKITDGLSASNCIGVVLSESSLKSRWVKDEWTAMFMRATEKGRVAAVLPILIDDVEIPILLAPIKYADFRQDHKYKSGLDELANVVLSLGTDTHNK